MHLTVQMAALSEDSRKCGIRDCIEAAASAVTRRIAKALVKSFPILRPSVMSSTLGHLQTSDEANLMSAPPPKADIRISHRHVH